MTEHTVKHHTFTLERDYPGAPDRVFAAWADPVAKARWFAGPDADHELDFRIGGEEVNRASRPDAGQMVFRARYHDIVPAQRIVFSATLSADDVLATVSLTTVQLSAEGDSTHLLLIEQGTFLDDAEQPEWRERGTADWLDALGVELRASASA
jgi:uncharacterized protein YndB with AHSA1/START domain